MTYPQSFVQEAIYQYSVPVQINNSLDENKPILDRFHHMWTPDLRILGDDGYEFYHWFGFLPPAEFAPRLLTGLAHARLRLKQYDEAIAQYGDVVKRFPTSFAAPEAQYFAATAAYRRSHEGNDLLRGWHELEKTYPGTEWTAKQNFD